MRYVKGFKGLYTADESGQVWSHFGKGRFVKPWKINSGYYVVMLYKRKRPKKFLVHRLIAEAFVPNPKKLPYVNHKNNNKTDNRPENLEWCTADYNLFHARRQGRWGHFGENHSQSKLTNEKVKEIRERGKNGAKQEDIALIVGISQSVVSSILRGISWSHIL